MFSNGRRRAGLSWPLPPDLDDEALRARLYPAPERDSGHAEPDWDAVIEELKAPRKRRRARLTRRQLWVEYRDEALARGGTAYSYSRFCARLKARLKDSTGQAQMRFDYAPGLYGLSDFSGKTLALRTGRGEKDVEIFVAVLAHSCLIYAEAVPNQSVRHWTMAHRRALEYFGGVPGRWIIDNLKSGVDKPDREQPQLNPSFREFAQRYNVAVLPARSGRPTDKGLVESAVGAVQTRILVALRHETFFSLNTINAAIRRELDRLNHAPMACGESRRAVFEANERASLQPLPANPWEWGEWIDRKVGPNCHVCIERNYYSVPDGNIGQQGSTRASASAWSKCSSNAAASAAPSISARAGATNTLPGPSTCPTASRRCATSANPTTATSCSNGPAASGPPSKRPSRRPSKPPTKTPTVGVRPIMSVTQSSMRFARALIATHGARARCRCPTGSRSAASRRW